MASSAIKESVQRCVAALKAAKSDNEKFASLFLVTKLVTAEDCDDECLMSLYKAMGFSFLNRLLKSREVPEGCPPFMYKSVALSVISSFCGVPEIVASPDIHSIIPVLLDIVSTADTCEMEDDLMLISDCYSCLHAIATSEKGWKALAAKNTVSKLADIYIEEMFRHDEALKLLVYLVSKEGITAMPDAEVFNRLMNRISNEFAEDTSEMKFELCKMMVVLLINSPVVSKLDLAKEEWPLIAMKTVTEILCSKIGPNQREPALQLVSRLLELMGVEWSLTISENSRQFLLLLVNLACVEIRMRLEEKTFEEVLTHADILVACYTIVELFIGFMMSQAFLDFDQKQREQVYCALKGAATVIIETLADIAVKPELENYDWNPTEKRTHFICASIRILGSWLSEETSSLHQAVCQVLPFVLTFCKKLYEIRKSHQEETPDPLRFLLPALCHLVTEDVTRQVLIREKTHELLFDYLQYQWKRFADWLKGQPDVPADWLHTDSDENIEYPHPDSQTALVLVCGIFMNYVVLEPKLISEDLVFSQLLKFCFNKVPELSNKQNLIVLFGNIAVLGLLILRHHSWKIREGDSAVFRYIQGTVSFLWDAHNSDESCDSLCLVISLRYKKDWPDLAELWFLGMQSLSNVLSKLPWIVDFIVDSGWPQEILKTLGKILPGAIDANTRTAYEDFLCCLVKADPKVKVLIKEKGGRHICKSHSLKELQGLLDARN